MAQVVGHLGVAELQAGWRESRDATLARHYQVIWLLAVGRSCAEVAGLTGFVRRWVEELVARYNRFGPSSLGDRRRGNGAAPRVLTPEVLALLSERVKTPPDDGGVWTAKKVARVMARALGVAEVPPQRGWEALRAIGWTIQQPRPRHAQAATPEVQAEFKKNSTRSRGRKPGATPDAVIEVFATDEHRIGLKPVLRRVWAPCGQRPVAVGHHRFEWLYATAFVSPATGESYWYLAPGIDKALFTDTLALFAREAGAGPGRIILLVLDNAGWHTAPLTIPEGIRLVYLPPYTPELQPAETLWTHLDQPIVKRHFETLADLDAAIARQCIALTANRDLIRGQAGFHWWPNRIRPN